MKYVRTKDGIYEVVEDRNDGLWLVVKEHKPNNYIFKISLQRVIKQADTVEELVDEYIARKDNGKPFVIKKYEIHSNLQFGCTIYGAIWVGLDLHCVAELNTKGELESLWDTFL